MGAGAGFGWGRRLVRVDAQALAPQAAQLQHARGVVVDGAVRGAPQLGQHPQPARADHLAHGAGDGSGLVGVQHCGGDAGEQQRGGAARIPRRHRRPHTGGAARSGWPW
ncbi:hypothetical protein E1285_43390 [Actinomadura sp. 7K507]|nr:hypothetical protein E1285_43390 [Actinomadura sp. 7K507]